MSISKNTRIHDLVTVDPNFSIPPGVVDMGYSDPLSDETSQVERSAESGEIVAVTYDEVAPSEEETGLDDSVKNDQPISYIPTPDYMTVVSQTTRQTSDGRYVVDVVLEVEDLPGVSGYEVGISKT